MAQDPTKNVISLQDARTYLGKGDSDTATDQLIDMLCLQASEMIAKELGTDSVVSTAYKEYHDGRGGRNMWLQNYPVTSVDFVSCGRDNAFNIEYDATDASYATVEVTPTQLKLRKRVSGTVTANSLTLADYATLTALETAVEALGGWAVTVTSTFANYDPESLVPVPARGANDSSVDLEVPDEGETECELRGDRGRLYNAYGWPSGHNNVYVEYTAGYARASIPEPIRGACMELVALMHNMAKKDASLRSEKIGEYQYTMADRLDAIFSEAGKSSVSNTIMAKLRPYRRVILGAA